MKKAMIIFAAIAAVASVSSCTKETDLSSELQNTGKIQIDLGVSKADSPETKAIQSDFVEGNTIFVFFNHDKKGYDCKAKLNNKEYLRMTYDGSKWVYDYNSSYLDTLSTSGTMEAIYFSNLLESQVVVSSFGIEFQQKTCPLRSGYTYDTDYDVMTAEDQTYTIKNGSLKGSINLERKKDVTDSRINLQISISDLPEGEWYFKTGYAERGYARFLSFSQAEPCSYAYLTSGNGSYVKLNPVGDDMAVYLTKYFSLSEDQDLTFYLYNDVTMKTYTRTVNTGSASNASSLYSVWKGSYDAADFAKYNTAIKMNFNSFEANVEFLDAAGRANCYIVTTAGNYTFETTYKGSSSESFGMVGSSAEVIWESFGTSVAPKAGDLISKVYLDGDDRRIYFKTTGKEGNALIAMKDGLGEIMWTWHIWMTDQPADQTYYNNAGTMMDRNLGATSATPGDVGSLGLLYQWGRKDPFLGSSSLTTGVMAASTITWPAAEEASSHLSDNTTLAYSIANPTVYLKSSASLSDWYCTSADNQNNGLWGSAKTAYDPCPVGYRVPDGGEAGIWASALGTNDYWLTSSNWDESHRGMDFGSTDVTLGTGVIWHPAAGCLKNVDGTLDYVGYNGYIWSCSPTGNQAISFYYGGCGDVEPSSSRYRASGLTVRCCKE